MTNTVAYYDPESITVLKVVELTKNFFLIFPGWGTNLGSFLCILSRFATELNGLLKLRKNLFHKNSEFGTSGLEKSDFRPKNFKLVFKEISGFCKNSQSYKTFFSSI